ncbi:FAD-binding oxidoreductase [Parashewanella curva]|uniref:FAD-binding oxidoreductase n=1 Tax=Parashewanella curva TaxID=2338552 RepID=A0A3L8Q312_9GAMM|nr:FAD-binding oxidoreductase [Parashewanella curva]RLV61478.1 FAD-binding oxidoreductase [Parashewanella curva]
MYDPLVNKSPFQQEFAQSYWADSVSLGTAQASLQQSIQTDVAIIGGGYTGLMTAYYLATEHGLDCVVIEANQVGFGASARNAGFVLKGSGRLSYPQMAKRWDLSIAKGIFNEFGEAVERVEALISENQIDCNKQENGYLKIAHSAKAMQQLTSANEYMQSHFGGDSQILSKQTLFDEYMQHHQAHGALRINKGFGIHPLKLLLGYKKLVQSAGIPIYENTSIGDWIQDQGRHRLVTAQGEVFANKVVCCGNAYLPKRFNPQIDNKILPILSNVIVTEPLSSDTLEAAGLKTHQVVMDTRILKYYYRLLPDNRLLFGGRGAVWGKDAANPKYGQRLKRALDKAFPALTQSKVDYNWTGWIAAAFDDMPHIFEKNGVGYSLGYCGSGVSYSVQAGYRLAQSIAGQPVPNLPLYSSQLPSVPFSHFRRWGQWAYYHYGCIKDAIL